MGKLLFTLLERESALNWLAWDPNDEARLAIAIARARARADGDLSIWDLAKIDQQLDGLGLGFAAELSEDEAD